MTTLSQDARTQPLPRGTLAPFAKTAVEHPRSPSGQLLWNWVNWWRAVWQGVLQPPWTFRRDWPLIAPAVSLLMATLVFRYTALDPTISSWFYDADARTWPWFFSAPCTFFYRTGIYPPFALLVFGVTLLLFGWMIDRTLSLSRAGMYLVLVMAIGPGLIINFGFKGHLGRARPHQVRAFGGKYEYSPVGSPGPLLHGNSSFPSGHAAIAFYLMTPGFLVGRQRPRLARGLFLGGMMYGIGMSATRVIQGGHFTSDVLWSGGIVYLLGALLARVVLREPASKNSVTSCADRATG